MQRPQSSLFFIVFLQYSQFFEVLRFWETFLCFTAQFSSKLELKDVRVYFLGTRLELFH